MLVTSVTSLRTHIAFKRKPRTHSNEFIYNSMPRSCFLEQFVAELYVFHLVWIQHPALSAVQWLRVGWTYNKLQIKQQHGIGSYIFHALLTFTQETQGKAEGHICPRVLDLQVAKAVTGSAPIHSSILLSVDFSWCLLVAEILVMWTINPAELITSRSAENGFPQTILSVVHITISIFPEKDNQFFSFPQCIMGSLPCALVCLCKVFWVFVHELWG